MKGRIAVVDDELTVCRRLLQVFASDDFDVEAFASSAPFLRRMKQEPFDIVLVDLRMPDMDGLEILAEVKHENPEAEVIVVTGFGSIESAIKAIKLGAFHYVTKPFKIRELSSLVRRAYEKILLRKENRRLREMLKGKDAIKQIVGKSPAMKEVFKMIHKVAVADCNVMIIGQSGTGKELVARAIHELSPRRKRPFVAFDCGGFTEEVIASELFGHEKGAFTGAHATKIGLMEAASGGTVFLDEISEMSLSMQAKLLRVIQQGRLSRVGGTQPIDLDIRLVAASNKDLKHEVSLGNFREDLFYCLNVVTIKLPPLTEREGDISLLISYFIEKYSTLFGKKIIGMEKSARDILLNYSFPGNVRELENIIERAVALAEGNTLTVDDLPEDLRKLKFETFEGEGLLPLEEMEKRYIKKVLEKTGYNKAMATQILKVPRTTLWRKLKKYKLESSPLPSRSSKNLL